MLYKIKIDSPYLCVAIDLNSIDVIELHEHLAPDGYIHTLNFYKADTNDAILSFNVTGVKKAALEDIFDCIVAAKQDAPITARIEHG